MFVHEYSDEEFDSYDACRDDLLENLEIEDFLDFLDLSVEEIVRMFLRSKNEDFCVWFQEKIMEAEEKANDDLITEYEEGEVD